MSFSGCHVVIERSAIKMKTDNLKADKTAYQIKGAQTWTNWMHHTTSFTNSIQFPGNQMHQVYTRIVLLVDNSVPISI